MNNLTITEILKEINMFSSLNDEDIAVLANISYIYTYNNKDTIFTQGEINTDLIILIDGIVSVFKNDDKGNEIVISYFNKYSLIAEAATLRRTALPSSAKFQSDGNLIKINIDEFEKLFISHPNISYAIIQSLLQKVDLLQQNIHLNIASNTKDKIIHFYKENKTLSLDLKQYEIASILNMVPETLSRNINKLVKEGILIKYSNAYKIVKI